MSTTAADPPRVPARAGARAKEAWRIATAPRNRWMILAGLALVGFALGYVGLREMASRGRGDSSPLTLLYRDLALVSFSSGNAGTGAIPWPYQVARFLVPVVVIYGAFAGLAVLFRDRFQQARLPFVRDHVVVVGLGEMGTAFAEAMRATRSTVVAIEIDPANPNVLVARESGIVVIVGDARERVVLGMAGVRRARRLLATADDATNVEVVVQAQAMTGGRRGDPLACLAHSADPEVCALLESHALEHAADTAFRVEFFNYHDQAARLLVRVEPPGGDHVVVVGSGPLADQVVIHAARTDPETRSARRIRLTIVGPDAGPRIESLQSRHPTLEELADLRPVTTSLDPTVLARLPLFCAEEGVGVVYACDDDDDCNVAVALALKVAARRSGWRIVVCSDRGSSFEQLLGPGSRLRDSIRVVAVGRETCTADLVDDGIVELLARAIHEGYVLSRQLEGAPSADDDALRPWAELPDALKRSNRAQAAHIGTKLGAVGCALVPFDGSDAPCFAFAADEVELLAEMEHDRWVEERQAEGWRFGPDRDVTRKTTPYLVGWADLAEPIRDRDRETVVRMAWQVNDAGFEIVRFGAPTPSAPEVVARGA